MNKIEIKMEKLKELYERNGLSTYQIANKFNCSQATIWKKLHQFDIKPRPPGSTPVNLLKDRLVDLYSNKKLSTWEIEKRYGYSRSTVYRKLLEFKIRPRSLAESHVIYPRKKFSGDLTEKAYLVGFAIGDLRARKVYRNSETVHVDCGSTKSEQINLIRKLFEKYGRVWISRPNKKGKIQIEAFLDRSFEFLLDLDRGTCTWILNSNDYFAPFLAGFTDAEGSFGIYDGMAVYQLGNYNSKLLFSIHRKLIKIGIKCPRPHEDRTKGYVTKHGYVHSQNYWHLCIHRKSSLLQLFELIEPYLKHERKIAAMKKAKENVELRGKIFGARI